MKICFDQAQVHNAQLIVQLAHTRFYHSVFNVQKLVGVCFCCLQIRIIEIKLLEESDVQLLPVTSTH